MPTPTTITHVFEPQTFTLLDYWHQGSWHQSFHEIPIKEEMLCCFQWGTPQDVEKGEYSLSGHSHQEESIWVCPEVYYSVKEKGYYIPFWIPANLVQGVLQYREPLPWISPQLFEPTALFNTMDDYVRFELADRTNWPEYFAKTLIMFGKIKSHSWQEKLEIMGFQRQEKVGIIIEKDLLRAFDFDKNNPLVINYGSSHSKCESPLAANPCGEEICGIFSGLFLQDESEYDALTYLLKLKVGELQAVHTPVGSNKKAMIATLIASRIVKALLEKNDFPIITLCTSDQTFASLLSSNIQDNIENDISNKNKESIYQALHEQYHYFKTGIRLAQMFYNADVHSVQADIDKLQQQDELYEKQISRLFQIEKECQKTSFWRRLFFQKAIKQAQIKRLQAEFPEDFLQVSEKNVELALSEKKRKLKVLRTKIHQELVRVVESLSQKNNIQKDWQQWCQSHISLYLPENLTQAIRSIQCKFGQTLLRLALDHWQCCVPRESALFTVNTFERQGMSEIINDLIIIDEANHLLPQEVLPFLSRAKQAVFLGDSQDILPIPMLSHLQDEALLAMTGQKDEEILEDLHNKGMLMGSGNAFSVALNNSAYGSNLDLKVKESCQTCEFKYMNIESHSERVGIERINRLEAQAVVAWLHSYQPCPSDLAIITPFSAQKDILKQYLQQAGIECVVLTFAELTFYQWDEVIFSPVYSFQDPRPFMFDQGDQYSYSLKARVLKTLWIFADMRIFDRKMHSPSGNLAKLFSVAQEKRSEFSDS